MNTNPRTDDRRSGLFRRSSLIALLPAVMMIAVACQSGGSASPPPTVASDWPQANHDFANTRVASGSAISSKNVHDLGVGWTLGVGGASTFGSLATSPIVVDGIVYLQDLKSNVYAIDLGNGKLQWQKRYEAGNLGPNGPAFDDGMLFGTERRRARERTGRHRPHAATGAAGDR